MRRRSRQSRDGAVQKEDMFDTRMVFGCVVVCECGCAWVGGWGGVLHVSLLFYAIVTIFQLYHGGDVLY